MDSQGDPLNWFSPHQRAILAGLSYVELQLLVRHCRKPMDAETELNEKLRAEYERLKGLDQEVGRLNAVIEAQKLHCEGQTAQIARLQEQGFHDQVELLRLTGEVGPEKDAEIERLRAEIKDQMSLIEDNAYQKQLITELCLGIDAVQLDTCTTQDWNMLNKAAARGREATRG